jgi:hypothetical protein
MINSTSIIALDFFIGCNIKPLGVHEILSDIDLAELFEISVDEMNRKVAVNISRFPMDFIIKPTECEKERLNINRFAFTIPGLFMLSSLLKTQRAVNLQVALIRLFVDRFPQLNHKVLLIDKE